MYDKDFKVKLINSKNSFIFLSEHDSRQIDHEHMIRLSYGLNKRAFFSLGTSLGSLKEGELAIGSMLAKELGIIKNDIVCLSTTPYIASIRRLKLLTTSDEDFEMIGELADTIQSTLLNQVKIVHNQQKLVIWITNSLHATVIVDGIEPISPGKLEMLTEVAILPPHKEPVSKFANQSSQSKRHSNSSMSTAQKASIMNMYNQTQCALRLHPVEQLSESLIADKKVFIEQPFSALLSRRNFERLAVSYHIEDEDLALVTLRIISPPADIKEVLDETHTIPDSVVVRLFCINDNESEPEQQELLAKQNTEKQTSCDYNNDFEVSKMHDVIYVHKLMFEYFHAIPGAKVIATSLKQKHFIPKSIDIVTNSKFFNKADELVRNYFCGYCQDGGRMLLNSGLIMEEPVEKCRFYLRFNPANENYLIVNQNVMRECKFKLGEVELVDEPLKNEENVDRVIDLCLNASNYQQSVDGIITCLKQEDSNAILTGKIGSGKTSVALKVAELLKAPPFYYYVENVSCKRLKGKNIESLLKTLNSIFLRLIYYQPSILIFDDLHVICEKVVEGEQSSQENLHFNKVSAMLSEELERLQERNKISILATTESMSKLNQNIYSSRGHHLFKNCFSINDLNKDDRLEMLKYIFKKKEVNFQSVKLDQLGIKTEGYLIQDLLDLVDKIIFEVYKTTSDISTNELVITDNHCEIALSNASTLSLRDVQLHSPGERDFDDIGGLEDIKKILIETMLWPAQYSNIFAKAPLRLQSGVLLYGLPGTGKTILAGAAAKQCNLRLISVKGPELLSKYIGASEQAVRDIFQKAQNAKPCILFFDEFDSLAPRRGHDNTGVTDRVVNQFLTQLDGVESLSGVCVLAATSRPDLLDPALLRPGRLDRQLLCPMPNKTTRLAILQKLSKKLHLSKDIKLEYVADNTEGFTGADLQAVLYTAQLNSVDHLLQDNITTKDVKTETQIITRKHLDDAIRGTRPSLTREERARYERIYQKFEGKSDILEFLKSGEQKATLA